LRWDKDFNPVSVDTDNVATEYGVSRQEQDDGRSEAIRTMETPGKTTIKNDGASNSKEKATATLEIDEQYRADSSLKNLRSSRHLRLQGG
jgi:hypothetical protein